MTSTRADRILKIAVPVPVPGLFDYLPGEGELPAPGVRVVVRFGRRKVAGVVVRHADDTELPRNRLLRVQRVLDQEFVHELIVVDDGSSDNSADLAEDVDDDRVRVIRQPMNRGKGAALRTGFV